MNGEKRGKSDGYHTRDRARSRARQRAWSRVARAHPREFDRYLREELAAEGIERVRPYVGSTP